MASDIPPDRGRAFAYGRFRGIEWRTERNRIENKPFDVPCLFRICDSPADRGGRAKARPTAANGTVKRRGAEDGVLHGSGQKPGWRGRWNRLHGPLGGLEDDVIFEGADTCRISP